MPFVNEHARLGRACKAFGTMQVESLHENVDAPNSDHLTSPDLPRPLVGETKKATAIFNFEDIYELGAKLWSLHF